MSFKKRSPLQIFTHNRGDVKDQKQIVDWAVFRFSLVEYLTSHLLSSFLLLKVSFYEFARVQ